MTSSFPNSRGCIRTPLLTLMLDTDPGTRLYIIVPKVIVNPINLSCTWIDVVDLPGQSFCFDDHVKYCKTASLILVRFYEPSRQHWS